MPAEIGDVELSDVWLSCCSVRSEKMIILCLIFVVGLIVAFTNHVAVLLYL